MIKLNELIGDEKSKKLASMGLHRLVAARLQKEGHDVSDELDMRSAVKALGTNIFLKNAEFKSIAQGLVALENLTGS